MRVATLCKSGCLGVLCHQNTFLEGEARAAETLATTLNKSLPRRRVCCLIIVRMNSLRSYVCVVCFRLRLIDMRNDSSSQYTGISSSTRSYASGVMSAGHVFQPP